MRFAQILNDELGCASYLVADGDEAIVVDPRWDVDVYVEQAERWGARITTVVDTHDHADHVSGRGRLARATGARALRPGAGIEPGYVLRAGNVRLEALPTPGHRPEHLALVLIDEERGEEPWAVLAGDSLLIGDVARPDLAIDPQEGARDLQASLDRILALGDHVELWPGHVGGSLCGGSGLSHKTSSTVGFERRAGNTTSTPDPGAPKPPNLQRVVELNKGELEEEPPPARRLGAEELRDAIAAGVTVVDARPAEQFDAGHLRGSLSLPPGNGRVTRMGWAAKPDEPLVVIDEDCDKACALVTALHSIGLWNVIGVAAADRFAWRTVGLEVGDAERWVLDDLAGALLGGRASLVDVRAEGEWEKGHVPGSVSLPLHELADGRQRITGVNPEGLQAGGTIAVACAAGGRAALAASILRRAGHTDVVRVADGGIADLPSHGVDLEA